jgi:hypothetical protein
MVSRASIISFVSVRSWRAAHRRVLACVLSLFVASGALAQPAHEGNAHEAEAAEHHSSRFAVAGFIGATREHGRNEPTLGVEGGFNISETWSVGAVIERADRKRDSTLVLLGVGWHPFGPALRFQFGVGSKDPAGKRETVIRTGIAYEIELRERWFVKPYLALDFIEHAEDEEVLGVYIGKGFQ